jgi:carboxylate-amine ligase
MSGPSVRSVGVEEELMLVAVDAADAAHVPIGAVLAADPSTDVEHELKLEQAEISTEPGRDLDAVAADLTRRRIAAIDAAEARGVRVAAIGTSPVPAPPTHTPDQRYARMSERFAQIVSDQLTCGAHVHVSVSSRAEGVAVIDAIRPWLSVLVAVSANSPFWLGRDTGYASFRTIAWGRWPTAGPTSAFGSLDEYDRRVAALIESGAALDPGMIYFDARLSARYPTVEIRAADVGAQVEDTLLIAALCRGLVETAARGGLAGEEVDVSLLRAASWRSARFGLSGELVDGADGRTRPALDVVGRLVDRIEDALRECGDLGRVRDGVALLARRGTGADLQRASFVRSGRLRDVVADAVERSRPTAVHGDVKGAR